METIQIRDLGSGMEKSQIRDPELTLWICNTGILIFFTLFTDTVPTSFQYGTVPVIFNLGEAKNLIGYNLH
jgi:hypothetical protein